MEDYRARIRDSMATASPIPVVKIVRSGSQRSLARPRSTTSMSQLLVNAKRTLDTPTPKVETFEYDKMKQSLEEAEAKSKMLDGDVRRGRVFPKRLKKADQEIVSVVPLSSHPRLAASETISALISCLALHLPPFNPSHLSVSFNFVVSPSFNCPKGRRQLGESVLPVHNSRR